ncbi:uncharacterized protein LOC130449314 [Diorhabda sublineata]|uniref:uncharacterized protein LOC130449314 n=1 Tax=Diorhabda sublineata TaxID=1163346 RepID=UPI0024E17841|nr:uncharacterized protein LOC130449314 [Diorhabda sublineata]
MNSIVAVIFVTIALVSAEPPRPFARQTSLDSAPYEPSGWKPNGPLLEYPNRNNLQAYGPPQTVYGPPQNESDAESTTTESGTEPTTTIEPEAENIQVIPSPGKSQSQKLEKSSAQQPNQFFFILPQTSQKLVLASPLRVVPAQNSKNAAPARLEEFPEVVQDHENVPVQVEQVQPLPIQTIPVLAGYVSQSSLVTPYSSSFVQIYQ